MEVVAGADAPEGRRLAREVAASGTPVVLTGTDAPALGALASALHDRYGVQVAVYVGDADDDVLAEMITELFGGA